MDPEGVHPAAARLQGAFVTIGHAVATASQPAAIAAAGAAATPVPAEREVREAKRRLRRAEDLLVKFPRYRANNYAVEESDLRCSLILNTTQSQFNWDRVFSWTLSVVIGVLNGVTAFLFNQGINQLNDVKFDTTTRLIKPNGSGGWAYGTFVGFSMLYALFGAILGSYVSPQAAGSGIPEIRCYLNGIHVSGLLTIRTFLAKAFGVVLSVSSGLIVGKEGPFTHMGAILGGGVARLGSTSLTRATNGNWRAALQTRFGGYFRSAVSHRDYVAAGAGAGVASAFGAPIGGILFSVEQGASFYNHDMLSHAFLSAGIAVYVVALLSAAVAEGAALWRTAMTTEQTFVLLNQVPDNTRLWYHVWELPIFAVIGVGGGLLGAASVHLNNRITAFRRRYIPTTKPSRRVGEVVLLAAITATAWFLATYLSPCAPYPPKYLEINVNTGNYDPSEDPVVVFKHLYPQLWCPDGYYNEYGMLFFQPQMNTITMLFQFQLPNGASFIYNLGALGTLCALGWLFMTVTFGIGAVTGLFVPSLLVGGAYGRLIGRFVRSVTHAMGIATDGLVANQVDICLSAYAVVGAGSVLGGVSRMLLCNTVLVMETAGASALIMPLIVSTFIAKAVADFLAPVGLLDAAIERAGYPYLEAELTDLTDLKLQYALTAGDLMSNQIVTLPAVVRIRDLVTALRRHHKFSTFPLSEPVEAAALSQLGAVPDANGGDDATATAAGAAVAATSPQSLNEPGGAVPSAPSAPAAPSSRGNAAAGLPGDGAAGPKSPAEGPSTQQPAPPPPPPRRPPPPLIPAPALAAAAEGVAPSEAVGRAHADEAQAPQTQTSLARGSVPVPAAVPSSPDRGDCSSFAAPEASLSAHGRAADSRPPAAWGLQNRSPFWAASRLAPAASNHSSTTAISATTATATSTVAGGLPRPSSQPSDLATPHSHLGEASRAVAPAATALLHSSPAPSAAVVTPAPSPGPTVVISTPPFQSIPSNLGAPQLSVSRSQRSSAVAYISAFSSALGAGVAGCATASTRLRWPSTLAAQPGPSGLSRKACTGGGDSGGGGGGSSKIADGVHDDGTAACPGVAAVAALASGQRRAPAATDAGESAHPALGSQALDGDAGRAAIRSSGPPLGRWTVSRGSVFARWLLRRPAATTTTGAGAEQCGGGGKEAAAAGATAAVSGGDGGSGGGVIIGVISRKILLKLLEVRLEMQPLVSELSTLSAQSPALGQQSRQSRPQSKLRPRSSVSAVSSVIKSSQVTGSRQTAERMLQALDDNPAKAPTDRPGEEKLFSRLTSDDMEAYLDLRRYMQRVPYVVPASASLARTYRLFRNLGLHHLFVTVPSIPVIGIITRSDIAPPKAYKVAYGLAQREQEQLQALLGAGADGGPDDDGGPQQTNVGRDGAADSGCGDGGGGDDGDGRGAALRWSALDPRYQQAQEQALHSVSNGVLLDGVTDGEAEAESKKGWEWRVGGEEPRRGGGGGGSDDGADADANGREIPVPGRAGGVTQAPISAAGRKLANAALGAAGHPAADMADGVISGGAPAVLGPSRSGAKGHMGRQSPSAAHPQPAGQPLEQPGPAVEMLFQSKAAEGGEGSADVEDWEPVSHGEVRMELEASATAGAAADALEASGPRAGLRRRRHALLRQRGGGGSSGSGGRIDAVPMPAAAAAGGPWPVVTPFSNLVYGMGSGGSSNVPRRLTSTAALQLAAAQSAPRSLPARRTATQSRPKSQTSSPTAGGSRKGSGTFQLQPPGPSPPLPLPPPPPQQQQQRQNQYPQPELSIAYCDVEAPAVSPRRSDPDEADQLALTQAAEGLRVLVPASMPGLGRAAPEEPAPAAGVWSRQADAQPAGSASGPEFFEQQAQVHQQQPQHFHQQHHQQQEQKVGGSVSDPPAGPAMVVAPVLPMWPMAALAPVEDLLAGTFLPPPPPLLVPEDEAKAAAPPPLLPRRGSGAPEGVRQEEGSRQGEER